MTMYFCRYGRVTSVIAVAAQQLPGDWGYFVGRELSRDALRNNAYGLKCPSFEHLILDYRLQVAPSCDMSLCS